MSRLASVFVTVCFAIACITPVISSGVERPNIVLIVADDLGYADTGFTGSQDISTPNLDALAASGVIFTQGYCNHAFCAPSRAAILSGRYQQRFGFENNPAYDPANELLGIDPNEKLFPKRLQDVGYVTGGIGKWHLGAAAPFHPNKRGFDYFYGMLGGGHDYFAIDVRKPVRGAYFQPLVRNGQTASFDGYLTTALSLDAVKFIEKNKTKPFFLYLAYNAPHTPLQAPKKAIAKYQHIKDDKRRIYSAMVDVMDQGIGRVVEALKKHGLRKNTLVFFLSDNGGPQPMSWNAEFGNGSSNLPFRGGKTNMYEGGIHVPFVASWPSQIPAGRTFDSPVMSLDIARTAVENAGADANEGAKLEGVDLIPFLRGETTGPPHEAIYWSDVEGKRMAILTSEGNKQVVDLINGKREQYYLPDDCGESNDLAAEKPQLVAEMKSMWNAWNENNIPPRFGSAHLYFEKRQEFYRSSFNGDKVEVSAKTIEPNEPSLVKFEEVSEKVGLKTKSTWKYGGPTIADLNGDGRYELILGNHDRVGAQLFWAKPDNTYVEHDEPIQQWDVHGFAAGDFDLDGDLDIVASLGGGNGKNPKPPRIKRNDDGKFVDVTEDSGIAELGARGRSPRWIDADNDGLLDLMHINAAQPKDEQGPRNIIFKNNGDNTFSWMRNPEFEKVEAERVLITDFNRDQLPDLVMFTTVAEMPLTLWQGSKNSIFNNVTAKLLPKKFKSIPHVNAVCEADFDNDGDLDLYIARGQTHYKTANNAISFDMQSKRLDLRDEGNKSHDGISFEGKEELKLEDFYHWPRGNKITLPVYLGTSKTKIETPVDETIVFAKDAVGFPETFDEDGWYLGYLGDGKWRLEWNLGEDLAWDIRASIIGVTAVNPDWKPSELGVPDILLRNEGGRFSDASDLLPNAAADNNWGVVGGDFNNDGFTDFFVYRFGDLIWRIPDVLFLNQSGISFSQRTDHGANVIPEKSHGDMGAAFDFNHDGNLDLLSGDDDNGRWRLYRNAGKNDANWIAIHVGYSAKGASPFGAEVEITTADGIQFKRVSSGSAVHSQSRLNVCHFGLADAKEVRQVKIKWRDGSTVTKTDSGVNQVIKVGKHKIAAKPNAVPAEN